ncbi:Formylglycine-generating sulfatase enzyme [Lacipirellula limnantheis]|uniref:Formylglycine-generating sulfatase enzyme n=2 Tax=Lacipirellula limnantheis TaxID=2528024 RepID=A0A517TYM3_9BACT|nr:Formylglycine-generating sulfatase enzyme [Lacipirellula limnantheis]
MKFAHLLALHVATSACLFFIDYSRGDSFGSGTNAFDIEFVPIRNPGNAADATGKPNPAGSVAYNYRMGKFEVSRDMIIKANIAGNLGITLWDMILYDGNGGNRPATGVNWNESARFVNWLNTSQGFMPAYKFMTAPDGTEDTAVENIALWSESDLGFNAANRYRNSRAKYFLPSVDEWYKAAYYDPKSGVYFDYPTGANSLPTSVANGTAQGTVVYARGLVGPADVMLAGGLSPYGTMGQGGNVFEWEETSFDLLNDSPYSIRGLRGGYWDNNRLNLLASNRYGTAASNFGYEMGFRVASVPEPSSLLIGVVTGALALVRKRRETGA